MNTMTEKTIECGRVVGSDYFKLIRSRRSDRLLKDFLPLFNFDDYWCFKITRHQRLVEYSELLEFKYSGYIFYKKDLYLLDHIICWVAWCKNIGGIQYLNRPLPPFNPKKIIIK